MASHPSATGHQTAPIANMEANSAVPAKRGPEDDVQFVSAQPVKKRRGSRDSSPAQNQHALGPGDAHTQDQPPRVRPSNDCSSIAKGGVPTSDIQCEPGTHNRGVSLPAMENYVFPPPHGTMSSQTTRSSPLLSPKQFPPSLPPILNQATLPTPSGLPAVRPGFSGLMPPHGLHIPWGMASLYPQHKPPMNAGGPLNRQIHLPPVQPPRFEPGPTIQSNEQPLCRSPTPTKPEPEPEPEPVPICPPASQTELLNSPLIEPVQTSQANRIQKKPETGRASETASHQAGHSPTQNNLATPPGSEPQPQASNLAQNPAPVPNTPQTQTQPQANTHGSVNATGAPRVQATKPPCAICEQMRQQAVLNQAHGYPAIHPPHIQHGWHGANPVHQQLQLAHPSAMGVGFGVGPQMAQNFPQRFHAAHPGHVPMGYVLPQVPFQVPMQVHRQLPTTNTTGTEQAPGDRQNHDGQAQQTATSPVLQLAPGVSQSAQPQYIPGHWPTLQQPMVAHRPVMMVHPQAPAAPAPPPPSPAVHSAPRVSQAPPEPEPQRERRKPSPNLIVDIAETCEELFPWDEVAKRHGVPCHKVVETFSAIIQLPLLRCTTDKKRHGKLATSRLREYTKAKKDVEAANSSSTTTAAATASTPLRNPFQTSQGPASQPQVSQVHANQGHVNQDRPILPGVLEMAKTMAPLGLPSTLTNGLTGPWQR